jgi:hypothetical protein
MDSEFFQMGIKRGEQTGCDKPSDKDILWLERQVERTPDAYELQEFSNGMAQGSEAQS